MACLPCQKKAEARKQAMQNLIAQNNPQAAKAFSQNVNAAKTTKVLPRYEWPVWRPITNTDMKPKTIWNEAYQAFTMNKNA